MHLCLQITEVLSAVLQAIDADSKLPTNAAMARTCRAFYEPASDALWEDLPRLGPLLKCLPEQTIRTLEYPSGLSHDLGNHQWTRFLTHAARVKSLRLCVEPPATDQEAPPDSADEDLDAGDQDSNYFDNIDEDLRTILFLRSRYEAPIFRNLRVLEVALAWQWNEAYSTYSPAFFGPKITTVRIEGSIRKLLLNQLVLGCPQLRCLEFESFMAGATGLLWCFNALEELRSHEQYFDDKLDLATVAYLPALRHLWITLTTLDTLQLSSVSHANDLPTLLEKVSSIRLRDLSINLDYDCLRDGNVVEAMDKTLCTLTKFPLLRRLRIRGSGSATSMFSPLPLLKLGSLEELSLETGGFFSTNQTIIDLGKACPRLRHLQIFSNDAGGGVPPSWKLDALELFATHLPKIHYIETEYDTSSVAPATRTPLAQSLLPTTLVVRSSVLGTSSGLYSRSISQCYLQPRLLLRPHG